MLAKATLSRFGIFGLGQNSPAAGDHGVGRKHIAFRRAKPFKNSISFTDGKTQRVITRTFAMAGRFVDAGCYDTQRFNADLTEKVQPPWRR